jgi:DNA-directed RNA polymerase subunit RPC12/RpoP
MAEQTTFTCKKCGYQVESWSDGNPYIQGPNGKRHYYYHPCEDDQIRDIVGKILKRDPSEAEIREMLDNHSGNEADYLCLECLKISK